MEEEFLVKHGSHQHANALLTLSEHLPYAVQQPDPSLPRPEGAESTPIQGEDLVGLKNCPSSLEAALLRWGAIAPKAPCLTTTHSNAKQPYTLTYGTQTYVFIGIHLV